MTDYNIIYRILNKTHVSIENENYLKNITKKAIKRWMNIIRGHKMIDTEYNIEIVVGYENIEEDQLCKIEMHDPIYMGLSPISRGGHIYLNINKINYFQTKIEYKEEIHTTGYITMCHEIGHILGFGYFFNKNINFNNETHNLINKIGNNYIYIGKKGLEKYNKKFNIEGKGIPLESEGIIGESIIHYKSGYVDYNQNDMIYLTNVLEINGIQHPGLNNELMCGNMKQSYPILSDITCGIMEDIGYVIDYSNIEEYNSYETTGLKETDDEIIYYYDNDLPTSLKCNRNKGFIKLIPNHGNINPGNLNLDMKMGELNIIGVVAHKKEINEWDEVAINKVFSFALDKLYIKQYNPTTLNLIDLYDKFKIDSNNPLYLILENKEELIDEKIERKGDYKFGDVPFLFDGKNNILKIVFHYIGPKTTSYNIIKSSIKINNYNENDKNNYNYPKIINTSNHSSYYYNNNGIKTYIIDSKINKDQKYEILIDTIRMPNGTHNFTFHIDFLNDNDSKDNILNGTFQKNENYVKLPKSKKRNNQRNNNNKNDDFIDEIVNMRPIIPENTIFGNNNFQVLGILGIIIVALLAILLFYLLNHNDENDENDENENNNEQY